MNSEQIFSIALGLQTPWEIKEIGFKEDENGSREFHLTNWVQKGRRVY